jgi:hypothetical protein
LSTGRLAKLRHLYWRDRMLLAEACFWLGVARLAVLALPFRWIAYRLGHHMAELPASTEPGHLQTARRVSWAVSAMSRHTPWRNTCLAQAIAAHRLLRERGVLSTLYLGLDKDEAGNLQAHAWLRCGDVFVTGRKGMENYTVVSTFAGKGP